jgi:hypothetical protein
MREPKRLAHRQAERNKARALKQWSWDDGEDEPEFGRVLSAVGAAADLDEAVAGASVRSAQL